MEIASEKAQRSVALIKTFCQSGVVKIFLQAKIIQEFHCCIPETLKPIPISTLSVELMTHVIIEL